MKEDSLPEVLLGTKRPLPLSSKEGEMDGTKRLREAFLVFTLVHTLENA